MSNQFIGNELEGIDTPVAPKVNKSSRPAAYKPSAGPAPSTYVQQARHDVLKEWQSRPALDPNAEIYCLDDWGRKVEVHAAGWETENNIPERRFKAGDIVTINHGFMAHTLLWGGVEDHEVPNYIQTANARTDLEKMADWITNNGTPSAGNADRNCIKPATVKARVLEREVGKTLTIGLLPVYEVQVIEGPLEGLYTMEFPSQITGADGKDADGLET